jgi:hypothetical protein
MVALPLWVNVVLVLGAGAIGVADAVRLTRRWPDLSLDKVLGRARYLYLPVAMLLPLFAAHVVLHQRPDLFWHLPVWLELYYMAIVWGAIVALFALLFGFAATVALRTRHHERVKLLIAAALLIGAVEFAQWRYTRPVAGQLNDWVTGEGIVMQSSGVSCAAASAANMARSLGIDKSEREMAELFGTTELGTSAAQVVRGFADLGIDCRKVLVDDGDVAGIAVPAMLFIDHATAGPESHAVARFAHAGVVEVWDPLTGSPISAPSLARNWHGRAVICAK